MLSVVEVGSGVHLVHASHTNFVLVREGDEVTLVDSGYPGDRDLVEESLAHVGLGVGALAGTLLTHGHVDHLGSAERLHREAGVPVHCHAAEERNARGEVREVIGTGEVLARTWRPKVLAFALNAALHGALGPFPGVTDPTTFTEGPLDLPGAPRPLHTPGHTSGHVCVHLPDRGVLLTGDALITVDVWDPSRRGPQLIRERFSADQRQAIASLDVIERVEADAVVPGHGRPYRGTPAAAVAEARRALG